MTHRNVSKSSAVGQPSERTAVR